MGTDYKPGTLLNLGVDQFIRSSQLYKADSEAEKKNWNREVNREVCKLV